MSSLYTADELRHPAPPDPSLCCESDEGGVALAFGDLNGDGSPVGVVTPDAVNQKYRDDTNEVYYWATGLTSADWDQFV